MDWDPVIARYREMLLRIVAMLFAMSGLEESAVAVTLTRRSRNHVSRLLRAAESAARRLVLIAAHRFVAFQPPIGAFMYGLDPGKAGRRSVGGRSGNDDKAAAIPPFGLLDPAKRFSFAPPKCRSKAFPRISTPGLTEPRPIPDGWFGLPDDQVDGAPLLRRLLSLKHALTDLDGAAHRLAKWQTRRDRAEKPRGRASPLRNGRPPGFRKRGMHEADKALRECHDWAIYALSPPDTS